jgi:prophage regulatory protein
MSPPDRIIRLKTVLDRTGLSRSTIYRKMSHGTFPRQLKLGERSAGWRESAVNDWIRDPMHYRDQDRPGR